MCGTCLMLSVCDVCGLCLMHLCESDSGDSLHVCCLPVSSVLQDFINVKEQSFITLCVWPNAMVKFLVIISIELVISQWSKPDVSYTSVCPLIQK